MPPKALTLLFKNSQSFQIVIFVKKLGVGRHGDDSWKSKKRKRATTGKPTKLMEEAEFMLPYTTGKIEDSDF